MRRISMLLAGTLLSGAAVAAGPGGAPVTIQNTPLPVMETGSVLSIKVSQGFNGIPFQPPNGVPSILMPTTFTNSSEQTALVHVYVSHAINHPYICGSGSRPTAIDVNIWPSGTLQGNTIQLPMTEHLSVRRVGTDYCWAEMSTGPLFVPPAHDLRFNIVYSETLPEGAPPVRINATVNGYYIK